VSRFPGAEAYASQAAKLIERYESVAAEEVHEEILHLLPAHPCRALDIGAGSGRDASWLADLGHAVTAVEPTAEMRAAGMRLHPHPRIEWIDDGLPELAALRARQPFDLVMATAVWMHLDAEERSRAMTRLAELARPGAVMAMLLRHGPVPEGRRMFAVGAEETAALAEAAGFELLVNRPRRTLREDAPAGVSWTALAFGRA